MTFVLCNMNTNSYHHIKEFFLWWSGFEPSLPTELSSRGHIKDLLDIRIGQII